MSIESFYQQALLSFIFGVYNPIIEKIAKDYNSKYSEANKISFLSSKTLDEFLPLLEPNDIENAITKNKQIKQLIYQNNYSQEKINDLFKENNISINNIYNKDEFDFLCSISSEKNDDNNYFKKYLLLKNILEDGHNIILPQYSEHHVSYNICNKNNIFFIDTLDSNSEFITVLPKFSKNFQNEPICYSIAADVTKVLSCVPMNILESCINYQTNELNWKKLDQKCPNILPHIFSYCQSKTYRKEFCEYYSIYLEEIKKRNFIKQTNIIKNKHNKYNKTNLDTLYQKHLSDDKQHNIRSRLRCDVLKNDNTTKDTLKGSSYWSSCNII